MKSALFRDAKRLLCPVKGVKFRLLFPDLLRMLPDGTLLKIKDLSAAVDFIKTIKPLDMDNSLDGELMVAKLLIHFGLLQIT